MLQFAQVVIACALLAPQFAMAQTLPADQDPAVEDFLARSNQPMAWNAFARLTRDEQAKRLEAAGSSAPLDAVAAAARGAAQIRQPDLRLAALRGSLSRWCETSGADAAKFAESLPLGRDHLTQLMSAVVAAWAGRDPAAGARFVASAGGPWVPGALNALLRAWIPREPALAVAWAGGLAPCPGTISQSPLGVQSMAGGAWVLGARVCREDALRAAVFYWARLDPAAAREWAGRQQPEATSWAPMPGWSGR